jgi:nitrite reductase (NADH) large subunit
MTVIGTTGAIAFSRMEATERLVVIGNGMGGARFVEELIARRGRARFDIVMFGDEPYGNYNRILLSNVLAGSHEPKDIFLNTLQWYEQNGITLHAGVRVESIDRSAKTVHAVTGALREPYDRLVFATGAKPFIPPIPGIAGENGRQFKDGIFLFRTLDDSLQIMKHAREARKAVVIGGGLLGLEAARGLLNRGLEVHVVELMPHPMAIQLDPPAGNVLKSTLEGMGIRFHLGKSVKAAEGNGHIERVVFSDESIESCDMLIISAGIRPNVDVAKQAGLTVERGIVVGDDLACVNDPSIYALGECAQHRGQTYGLVAPAWEQGQILADRLSGVNEQAAYTGSSTSTKLKIMGVDLVVLGKKEPADDKDEVVTYADSRRGIYKKVIVRDGRLTGAILLGDSVTAPRLLQTFHRGETIPENPAELLFPLASADKQMSAADAPDSFQVCNCNGVSKGKIVEFVKSGCKSLKSLCESTRAGTGCGSCKTLVKEILEAACDGAPVEDPSVHYYVPAVPFGKPELVAKIRELRLRSVSAVFATLAGGKEDAKSKVGLASLLKTIWGAEYEDERDARFINDRVHANIQKDATFSVVPRIYGGVTSPQQLRTIADVAEKYSVPMVKITGGQRIDLLGVKKEQLPSIWKDLGMPSGHAYTKAVRTVKTCVGEEFCRYGVGDSTGLGIKIEQRFQGMEAPHKIKMAASGCPRNCAESTVKDVGVVAIEGGRWEIYVGGAAGSSVRKGDLLCTVDTHEEVLKLVGRFIQYYRENAKYLERTYHFLERVGIEKVRQVLLEDSEGICDRLDAEIDRTADSFRDPWQEGVEPIHPLQFVEALEPVGAGSAK